MIKLCSDYSEKFDGVTLAGIKVTQTELYESEAIVQSDLKRAINIAMENIDKFHRSQLVTEEVIETVPGVKCWRRNVPVEKVGLYVPGGSAPLFSTVLMLGIPARIAGCSQIILCTPPDRKGNVNPLILFTAALTGITDIYKIGGAQAIAAMAYGTETVPKVSKIFGPGNQYVTKAKELVQWPMVLQLICLPVRARYLLLLIQRQILNLLLLTCCRRQNMAQTARWFFSPTVWSF